MKPRTNSGPIEPDQSTGFRDPHPVRHANPSPHRAGCPYPALPTHSSLASGSTVVATWRVRVVAASGLIPFVDRISAGRLGRLQIQIRFPLADRDSKREMPQCRLRVTGTKAGSTQGGGSWVLSTVALVGTRAGCRFLCQRHLVAGYRRYAFFPPTSINVGRRSLPGMQVSIPRSKRDSGGHTNLFCVQS